MRNDTTTRCVSYVRIAVTNTTHENSILFLSITSNVLLNVLLFPSMVSMRQGKNNVLIQSVPNPPLSAKCEVCGVRPCFGVSSPRSTRTALISSTYQMVTGQAPRATEFKLLQKWVL
eukprot:m.194287 g.194287  ORF g.194287 m.194287 type:complete len:117 (+) comp10614_c1_seq2:1-351(+)